ncbi:MAG: hypothetical protein KZQ65_10180, partial [Candidatus Thiodiazotropha sp. (ex Gloverina cf. vestifex)]|nr:hypothetical protein [Candidatus Thiodiazotropha sp. (ex Gloverina cf. vestifex)]
TVTITAIQPRLRLSGTNRLGFQPSMAISDRQKPSIGAAGDPGVQASYSVHHTTQHHMREKHVSNPDNYA